MQPLIISTPFSRLGRIGSGSVATGSRLRRQIGIVSLALVASALGLAAPSARAADGPKEEDHWHMAYGFFVCDKYVRVPPASGRDPLGIHTHSVDEKEGDGLIHIHPFGSDATGKKAVMKLFFDTEGFKATKDSLTVAGKTYRSGGECRNEKSTVRTLVWESRAAKLPKVHSGDPSSIPLANGQLVAFVYAPDNVVIPQPPSRDELEDPADLPPPALSAKELAAIPGPPAKVPVPKIEGAPPTKLRARDYSVGSGAAAKSGSRVYVRYTLTNWRTKQIVDSSNWNASEQPVALPRLGRKRLLPGLDKGLVGMKVGGVREIVVPPSDGFGSEGNAAIGIQPKDTIVFVVQMVAIR